MSLDGKVATQTGDSKWISGEESRRLVHRWRGEVDAICIGIGTALADDPLLTARTDEAVRQPRRVVFDSEARLPLDSDARSHGARGAADRGRLARGRPRAASTRCAPPAPRSSSAAGGTEQERAVDALEKLGDARHPEHAARGRPAPGGRLPRRRRGRRDAPVHRADRARRALGARVPFEGEGSDSIADAQRALSTDDASTIGEDVLITARFNEW